MLMAAVQLSSFENTPGALHKEGQQYKPANPKAEPAKKATVAIVPPAAEVPLSPTSRTAVLTECKSLQLQLVEMQKQVQGFFSQVKDQNLPELRELTRVFEKLVPEILQVKDQQLPQALQRLNDLMRKVAEVAKADECVTATVPRTLEQPTVSFLLSGPDRRHTMTLTGPNGRSIVVANALVDTGSKYNFLSTKVIEDLGLPRTPSVTRIKGFEAPTQELSWLTTAEATLSV
jgi:hypothetical protein